MFNLFEISQIELMFHIFLSLAVLQTANFNTGYANNLATLEVVQPDRPKMVSEFWSGWFDHWLSEVHVGSPINGQSLRGY